MSNLTAYPRSLDIEAWVQDAKNDPLRHRERQVAHVLFVAISRTPQLRDNLLLKGGTLLSAAYRSTRVTGDVDFTATIPVQPFADQLRDVLDRSLALAAEEIGYGDLILRVQRIKPQPRLDNFATADRPALEMTVGSAKRGTTEEKHLKRSMASHVLRIDVSFNEPAINIEAITIDEHGSTILAYGIEDIVAEKLRALLQQPIRNRLRRQDIYDILWIVTNFEITAMQREKIHFALKAKADARDVEATRNSFDDPEIKRRAGAEWNSLTLEVEELPDFEASFSIVREFYRALPW
jgi:predicted nucleotidyltransferase component of viral defense system